MVITLAGTRLSNSPTGACRLTIPAGTSHDPNLAFSMSNCDVAHRFVPPVPQDRHFHIRVPIPAVHGRMEEEDGLHLPDHSSQAEEDH